MYAFPPLCTFLLGFRWCKMSCYTVKWFGMALMKALVFSVHMYEGTDSDMHAQPFLR